MNCCDEYGDCRQGRDCPVRKTASEQRAIKFQADTDQQHAQHSGDLPQPTGPLSSEPDGTSVALALGAVLAVWLLAVVVAPFLAGWWHP